MDMDKYKCQVCDFVFESQWWPYECPECGYYDCGDPMCCGGDGFRIIEEEVV